MKTRKFIDKVTLYAAAGNGGNGSVSFRREKFVPKGGPDGGDGGRGGHVIIEGDKDRYSLEHIFFAPHQRGEHGGHGKGKKLYGRRGKDCIVKVPCGTEVRDNETQEVLADIVEPGQQFVAANGGKGGLGNVHWKSSTNQAPTEHTDGIAGEEVVLRLILKIIADVGLVGYPNAGKSSLLTSISDAHPRIGSYPFTTLNPIIGTVIFEDYTRRTVADIPGLIKGAHEGVGLGHDFLRHIERASCLIYMIDMAGVDTREPWDDYENLQEELRLHMPELMDRPSLVVANKMDLEEAEEKLSEFISKTGVEPVKVSAQTGEGLKELKERIYTMCSELKPPAW